MRYRWSPNNTGIASENSSTSTLVAVIQADSPAAKRFAGSTGKSLPSTGFRSQTDPMRYASVGRGGLPADNNAARGGQVDASRAAISHPTATVRASSLQMLNVCSAASQRLPARFPRVYLCMGSRASRPDSLAVSPVAVERVRSRQRGAAKRRQLPSLGYSVSSPWARVRIVGG
jgi:hypothetical protein